MTTRPNRSSIIAVAFIALAIVSSGNAGAKALPFLTQEPAIASWLPPQPQPGDPTDAFDLQAYFSTRPLALPGTTTLDVAQGDDVLTAATVALRFTDAVGGTLTPDTAPQLIELMDRVLEDDSAMLAPLKRATDKGGRVRPYVRFPDQPACPHQVDDTTYHLNTSGSYPSGHATYGWIWGLVLSTMVPEREDAIMQRAYAFGQSRLVCGFHFPSDLAAGRLAASALFARLMADHTFVDKLRASTGQVRFTALLNPVTP